MKMFLHKGWLILYKNNQVKVLKMFPSTPTPLPNQRLNRGLGFFFHYQLRPIYVRYECCCFHKN
jgi:hypothetical protein